MPKQALRSLRVLAVFVLVSSGCTSIKVEITGTDESTPAAVITSTHHSVFWDLFSEGSPVEPVKSCSSGGLYSVEHKVNYLYNLLSVVTLGAWVPMQVE